MVLKRCRLLLHFLGFVNVGHKHIAPRHSESRTLKTLLQKGRPFIMCGIARDNWLQMCGVNLSEAIQKLSSYLNFAYSDFAVMKTGISASASFHNEKKS